MERCKLPILDACFMESLGRTRLTWRQKSSIEAKCIGLVRLLCSLFLRRDLNREGGCDFLGTEMQKKVLLDLESLRFKSH